MRHKQPTHKKPAAACSKLPPLPTLLAGRQTGRQPSKIRACAAAEQQNHPLATHTVPDHHTHGKGGVLGMHTTATTLKQREGSQMQLINEQQKKRECCWWDSLEKRVPGAPCRPQQQRSRTSSTGTCMQHAQQQPRSPSGQLAATPHTAPGSSSRQQCTPYI